jgi:PPOX class probable F420-dependent enzyme
MPSRREMIQMSEAEVNAFLRTHKTIIIVSNGPGGFPHPMPMWFAVDDDNTVWMTTFRKSQKVMNLRRDPRVSLLAEAGESYDQLRGVVIYGRARVVDELAEVTATLLAIGGVGATLDPEARKRAESGVARTAEKRVAILIRSEKTISWDHRKLGGTY